MKEHIGPKTLIYRTSDLFIIDISPNFGTGSDDSGGRFPTTGSNYKMQCRYGGSYWCADVTDGRTRPFFTPISSHIDPFLLATQAYSPTTRSYSKPTIC